jgi:hypothetical protein
MDVLFDSSPVKQLSLLTTTTTTTTITTSIPNKTKTKKVQKQNTAVLKKTKN